MIGLHRGVFFVDCDGRDCTARVPLIPPPPEWDCEGVYDLCPRCQRREAA